MMLTEVEERIVALCGGESFSTGDAHLGIQPFPVRNSEMQLVSNTRNTLQGLLSFLQHPFFCGLDPF